MGQKFSQCLAKLRTKPAPEIKVGMLGLDNAGKTTTLYYFKNNSPAEHIVPTIGFNVETVHYDGHAVIMWDVSGSQPKSKGIWSHYNKNTKAIIFVVDAADRDRLHLAAEELESLWWSSEFQDAIFLIYANKQDLDGALNGHALGRYLNLDSLTVRHPWFIQECSAITGAGLWDGVKQLMHLYAERRKKNSLRLSM